MTDDNPTLATLLTPRQQLIALQCMEYVAEIFEAYKLAVVFGSKREVLLNTIETWPNCEDDALAFWTMDTAVGFALAAVPPSASGRKRDDWFDFSIEEGQEFLFYRMTLRSHYERLCQERRLNAMME